MLQEFLGDILPEHGYYCLCLLPDGKHIWTDNLPELAFLATKYQDRTGVYYATAAFQSDESRKQDNVLSLKAFRLDIDAGAKKHAKDPNGTYPTQRDALVALMKFIGDTGLAPTYIVSSGEGLHVYYCLDTPVAPAAWVPVAEAMKAACVAKGFKADPSVTSDTARILRPVGALHSEGKRVSVLKKTGKVYDLDRITRAFPAIVAARKYDTSINADVDLVYQGPPSSALKITEHCAALREVAVKRGDVQEPLWRAMIGLVKRTVEGADIAHEWSDGYDGYDYHATQRKFDAWATGPTTCAEFSKHTQACQDCQYRGKVKSPINLGLMTAPEIEELPEEKKPEPPPPSKDRVETGVPWQGLIPENYEVLKAGNEHVMVARVQTTKESETGEEIPVIQSIPFTNDVFWFGEWAEAYDSHDTAQVTLFSWNNGRPKQYMMDLSLVARQSNLLEFLAGKAIQTTTHRKAAQAMQDYTRDALQRLKNIGRRMKIGDHLGLRVQEDGELVAAHGKHIIHSDGSIAEAFVSASLRSVAEQFPLPLPESRTKRWAPDVWASHIEPLARKHVDFLKKYYLREGMERFQLAIMMGVASPLMAFVTGGFHTGSTLPRMSALSVSLYSRESARGKTTAAMAAALAYGRGTELANDAGRRGATDNGRIARLSMNGTMPNIMDEMGGANAGSVADMVSAVANGAGKQRATRDGGINEAAPWALVNIITTNTSQRDMICAVQENSGAIQYRLLEIDCDNMPEYDQDLRDSFADDWAEVTRDCAGALGAILHREICAQGVDQMNKLVADCCSRASVALGADQTARFQYRGLGAMFAAHLLLSKLGLSPFPLAGMVEVFKEAYEANKDFVAETVLPNDGVALLNEFLADITPNTIITENQSRLGRFSTKFDEPLNARVPDVIVARHVKSLKRTFFSQAALRKWCGEKGVSEREIVKGAKAKGVLVPFVRGTTGVSYSTERLDLTSGMRTSMDVRLRCYQVKVDGLYEESNVIPLHPENDEAAQTAQ